MTLTRALVDVQLRDTAPAGSPFANTSTAFVVGLFHKGVAAGPLAVADAIHSESDLIAKHGPRQTYNGPEYDACINALADGVTTLYVSRKVGPAATKAQITVPSSSPQYTVIAKGPGVYANGWTFTMTSSVGVLKDALGNTLETTPALTDVAALQDWATRISKEIDITPSGSGALTDSAARTLTGGADDRTNIVDAQIQTALDRFARALGPGQIAAPGDVRAAMHLMLAQHGLARNRFAYGDTDNASAATVAGLGTTMRANGTDLARHIQLVDNWVLGPPLTAGGAPRISPGSGLMLGGAATIDAGGNPNVPVAGPNFVSRWATGVKYTRTDADLDTLAAAGVTPILVDNGVRPMDNITSVDPDADLEWVGASGNRLIMRVVEDARTIGKAHQFKQVDPKYELSSFNGDLVGMLRGWLAKRALFTDDGTEADAFRVETGSAINTPATIAQGQLLAALSLKVAPGSRQVTILITNTPLNAAL